MRKGLYYWLLHGLIMLLHHINFPESGFILGYVHRNLTYEMKATGNASDAS